VFYCLADNICETVDADTVRADCGIDGGDVMPYWSGVFESFENYFISSTGTYINDGEITRGGGWDTAAFVGETSGRQIVAIDDLSSYTDGQDLIGASGGEGWSGGWSQ
jgi:hypothetical protein